MATTTDSSHQVIPLLRQAEPYLIEQQDLDKFNLYGNCIHLIEIKCEYREWLIDKIKKNKQVVLSSDGCPDKYYLRYCLPDQLPSYITYFSFTEEKLISYGKIALRQLSNIPKKINKKHGNNN